MTQKLKYKAFGYRIIFDIHHDLKEPTHSKLGDSGNNTNNKRKLKHITLNLIPKKCFLSSPEKNCTRTKINSKKKIIQPVPDQNNSSSSDSTCSDSSFYSCRSCISFSEDSDGASGTDHSAENNLESEEEICHTTVINKEFVSDRLKHKRPQKTLVNNISTRQSPVISIDKSVDLKNFEETYKDKISFNKSFTDRKSSKIDCDENIFEEQRKITKIRMPKVKFAFWMPVKNQNDTIDILCLDSCEYETGSKEKTKISKDSNPKKGFTQDALKVLKSGNSFLKLFSGEGDNPENQMLSNNTITNLSKVMLFFKSSKESCCMMIMRNSLRESQFDRDFVMNHLNATEEQSALLLQPKDSEDFSTDWFEREETANTYMQTLPAVKIQENTMFQDKPPQFSQNQFINKETKTNVILNKVKETSRNNTDKGERLVRKVYAKPNNGLKSSLKAKNHLPIIEEESTESLYCDFDEEVNTETYCLVDTNENPIRLFDSLGLPLTDQSGRPLRDMKGNFLMNCDENGIPIVGFDDFNIFDMFGNGPYDEEFNPSVCPEAGVRRKFSTSDRTPLLLFDIEGKPLTSISGTLLVDSCGRCLINLNDQL